jgi:hypothetical protein
MDTSLPSPEDICEIGKEVRLGPILGTIVPERTAIILLGK